MATPRNNTYAVASGAGVYAGIVPPSALPAWRQGMAVGEIRAVSVGAFPGDPDVIDAWGCMVLIDGTATLVAHGSGHSDGFDNGVYSLDLMADSPAWQTRIASSSIGSVINDGRYYADGKPGAAHTYHYMHHIPQRNRIMRFGQRGQWPTGGDGYAVDGIDISGSTWAWDPAGTYPDIPPGHWGLVRNPVAGTVWTVAKTRWNSSSNTFTTHGGAPSFAYFPAAFDSLRGEIFGIWWGDGQGAGASVGMSRMNATSGAPIAVSIAASAAFTQFTADQPRYTGFDYDPDGDRYLCYSGIGAQAGRIFAIKPNGTNTWDMTTLATSGAALPATAGNGINGRFKHLPALGGFFVYVSAAAGLYFLRTV